MPEFDHDCSMLMYRVSGGPFEKFGSSRKKSWTNYFPPCFEVSSNLTPANSCQKSVQDLPNKTKLQIYVGGHSILQSKRNQMQYVAIPK